MPKGRRARKALVAAEALAVLKRLAHKGAYATAAASETAPVSCAIYSPRNGFSGPVLYASLPAVAYGRHLGWFASDASGTQFHISAAGLRALRTIKSSADASAGNSHQSPAEAGNRPGTEGALAWLRRRRDKDGRPLITEVQFNAGEKLASDYWHAQLSPRVTANWSAMAPVHRVRRGTPGFGVDMRDAVVSARRRFQRALEAVGPELAGILVDVCCRDMGLEASGQAEGWPQRAAKVVLDLALTRLARHYGLLAPERPAAERLRHWGDANYRPTLDAWHQDAGQSHSPPLDMHRR
jgi:Domain of unknown function (DUF6456)